MNDVVNDPGVFIRSMATRGALGGLCRAAADAIDLFCASGRRLVLVETVGVGQDEVDIMRVAHTTIVVSVPGLGDDIQALKAGIVEIADIHAVNKADRDGADRTIAELRTMLSMTKTPAGWQTPVIRCVAARDEGVAELLDQAFMHLSFLQQSGGLEAREQRMAEARVTTLAHSLISATVKAPDPKGGRLYEEDIARVARREWSPYRCAAAVITRASGIDKERTYV
jgi:LAO/AO transport system kinase